MKPITFFGTRESRISHCRTGFCKIGRISGCCSSSRRNSYIIQCSFQWRIFLYQSQTLFFVILQGICNANKKFVDIFTRFYESVHDVRVWHMSHIKGAIENDPDRYCPGGRYILGYSAYHMQYKLLPPYRNNGHRTETVRYYNTVHSKTRVVIENIFALLKGRFWRSKLLYVQFIEYVPLIILACCVLHNICIDLEDDIHVEEIDDLGNEDIGEEQYGRDFSAAIGKRNVHSALLMEQRTNV